MVVFNLPHNQWFPLSSRKQDIALTLSYLSGFLFIYIYLWEREYESNSLIKKTDYFHQKRVVFQGCVSIQFWPFLLLPGSSEKTFSLLRHTVPSQSHRSRLQQANLFPKERLPLVMEMCPHSCFFGPWICGCKGNMNPSQGWNKTCIVKNKKPFTWFSI